MPRITIEQLADDGSVFRTFEQYPRDYREAAERLHRITFAYNIDHTRVTLDGRIIDLDRSDPDTIINQQIGRLNAAEFTRFASAGPERCPVCGGLNPGNISHTRCM